MRKIIDGIEYDTHQARLIGRYDNNQGGILDPWDDEYWSAGLYQTPESGQYFRAGVGGSSSLYSQYAQYSGPDLWIGGTRIDPLSRDEAYEWAQQYLSPEIVEQEFPDMGSEA